jgi:proteasome accessory factor A
MEASHPPFIGTEMEYWPMVKRNGQADYRVLDSGDGNDNQVIRDIFYNHVPDGVDYLANDKESTKPEMWLGNGARFYIDIGQHFEYAAAEAGSVHQAIVGETVGERFVQRMFEDAKDGGVIDNFVIPKRVVDEDRQEPLDKSGRTFYTSGYHENYLINRSALSERTDKSGFDYDRLALLGLHLATRNLYCGAGSVRYDFDRGTWWYSYGQKVLDKKLVDISGASHTTDKALVNTRDVPHLDKAGEEKYARLHVINGDPNMSYWSSFMKFATTQTVAYMMEHGLDLPELKLKELSYNDQPLSRLAYQVATDLAMEKTVELENGKTILPRDIQYEIFALAKTALPHMMDLTPEMQTGIDKWEQTVAVDLPKGPERLDDRADTQLKKNFILHQIDRKNLQPDDIAEIRDQEKRYDWLKENQSVGAYYRKRMPESRTHAPSEDELVHYFNAGDETTRASVRGAFVRQHHQHKIAGSKPEVSWRSLVPPKPICEAASEKEKIFLSPWQMSDQQKTS